MESIKYIQQQCPKDVRFLKAMMEDVDEIVHDFTRIVNIKKDIAVKMMVVVIKQKDSFGLFYAIYCDSPSDGDPFNKHPFHCLERDDIEHLEGEVVTDNRVTRALFDNLALSEEDMAKEWPNKHITEVVSRTIAALSLFWV